MNFLEKILTFFEDAVAVITSYVTRPPTPAPIIPTVSLQTQMTNLILANTMNIPPMSGTGGVVHKDSPELAATVAAALIADAAKYRINLALAASFERNESDFDPLANDPNNQDAAPGETPAQAFLHDDIGLGQLDGSTLVGMPQFRGMTVAKIIACAYDVSWASNELCSLIASNMAWAKMQFAVDPSLAQKVPGGTYLVLACQAYNSGCTGALHIAHTSGMTGNWAYGNSIVSTYGQYKKILGT